MEVDYTTAKVIINMIKLEVKQNCLGELRSRALVDRVCVLSGMGQLLRIANGRCLRSVLFAAQGQWNPPSCSACGVVLTSRQRRLTRRNRIFKVQVDPLREELAKKMRMALDQH
ncbi:hypothetical protein CRENBAI_001890 [Crenichthys baileyi]|uniref:Uncharacterized protein n=1 Tax=Crenichthys baileyi TaxID=28760 RepID=A0AAV9QR60_9TELE